MFFESKLTSLEIFAKAMMKLFPTYVKIFVGVAVLSKSSPASLRLDDLKSCCVNTENVF